MKLIPLPFETQARLGFTHKLILDYTDLSGTSPAFTAAWTSGTAQAVIPPNLIGVATVTFPAGYQVGPNMVLNVITPFTSSGGAITTLTLSMGDGGSATRFINAASLKTAGYTGSTTGYTYQVADTIDAVATIAGQTMASLNAGQVEIYFDLNAVPDLTLVN